MLGKRRPFTVQRAYGTHVVANVQFKVSYPAAFHAHAVAETVAFLQREAGLTAADAYALASLCVDFRIGEAVNLVKMVCGAIPKRVLRA